MVIGHFGTVVAIVFAVWHRVVVTLVVAAPKKAAAGLLRTTGRVEEPGVENYGRASRLGVLGWPEPKDR